jgi:hypothetical protein
MENKDRIKNIMLFLLLGGHELDKTNLVHTLTELADLSGLSGTDDFSEDVLCREFPHLKTKEIKQKYFETYGEAY